MRQWTVDAFAAQPFRGNPACVVEPFDAWPSTGWMQALAAENNQAETAFLLRTPDSEAGDVEAHSPNSIFLEGFYDNNNNPTGWVPPGSVPVKDPGKTTADPATRRNPRPGVKPPVVASNTPGGRVPDSVDLSNPGGASISDRDVEEVLEAQQRFGAGLKWCFERALKTNPDLKGASNRYDVQITITAVGGVRGVSVAGKDKVLKDCLQAKVNTWNFKPAKGDFTTQFPIVFN